MMIEAVSIAVAVLVVAVGPGSGVYVANRAHRKALAERFEQMEEHQERWKQEFRRELRQIREGQERDRICWARTQAHLETLAKFVNGRGDAGNANAS